ncbi:MAG: hypothetical protein O2875_01890, partial [Planctomycetota bacterium]|nr:hypothetical protein [Planctomycetota bacterium]
NAAISTLVSSPPPAGLALMPENVELIRIKSVEDPFQYEQTIVVQSIDTSVGILRTACAKQGAN